GTGHLPRPGLIFVLRPAPCECTLFSHGFTLTGIGFRASRNRLGVSQMVIPLHRSTFAPGWETVLLSERRWLSHETNSDSRAPSCCPAATPSGSLDRPNQLRIN